MSETEGAAPQEGTEQPVPAAGEGAQAPETPAAPPAPEQAEAAPEAPAKEETPAPQQWWQKRISEIARQKHEATREAEQAKRERDFYRQQVEARGQTDPNAPAQPGQPPQNLTDAQIEERANAIAARREFERGVARTLEAGNTKFGEPAFVAACNTLASLGANEQPAFMQAVTDLDSGAEVLQHLGTHPEVAARIMALQPVRMAMELARLEARITAPAPAKPLSRAPAPIAPLEGGVSPAEPDIYDPDISPEKFIAIRNKQEAARRGR